MNDDEVDQVFVIMVLLAAAGAGVVAWIAKVY